MRQVQDVRCFGGTLPWVPISQSCASTGVGLCNRPGGGLGSPNGIENALGQVMVAHCIGDAQISKCESVVGLNERSDELVQKISTPIGDVLVVSLQREHRFPPVNSVLLPAGYLALKKTSGHFIDTVDAVATRSWREPDGQMR